MPAKGWKKTKDQKGNRINIRVSDGEKAIIYFICQDNDLTISELFRIFILDEYRKHLERARETWI